MRPKVLNSFGAHLQSFESSLKVMCRKQNTLKSAVSFEGAGIHTGCVSKITVNPASENFGIVFKSNGVLIPASYEYVVSTRRSTVIGKDGASVSTIEHLMAALSGLRIDNALIEAEGPEIPILDGSALLFCRSFAEAGIEAQNSEIEEFVLQEPVFAASGNSLVLALPCSCCSLEGDVNYCSPQVGHQNFKCSFENFVSDIAPARTFGFWAEVKELLAAGLGQGGDLSNALIFDRPGFDISSLRFENEPVRHKILDLSGDLNLLGRPLCAHVLAVKAGHALHVEFVRKLAEVIKNA